MRPALVAQVAVTTSVTALLCSFAAQFLDQQAPDQRAGPVLQALLVTVALLGASWFAVRARLLSATRGQLRVSAVVGLAAGFVLTPTSWGGRSYAAQIVTDPGRTALLLDLLLWLVVGTAAAVVASSPAPTHERASYASR